MYFNSLQTLLFMEGHGVYVWTVYLLTIGVIIVSLIAPLRRRNRLLARVKVELGKSQTPSPGSKA